MFDQSTPPSGRVATLGMLIIDHFAVHDAGGREVPADEPILGGGGLYATVAARQFLPASNVGFIADVGPDFPPAFRQQLEGLGEMVYFRSRDVTTRALNIYSGSRIGEGAQSFRYLVPRKQITPRDYLPPCPVGGVSWLHVVCDTQRAVSILEEAEAFKVEGWKGKMAWEPLVRTNADVADPNHLELQTIVGRDDGVEANAAAFQARCSTPIVVRAGADGAFALSSDWKGWVPAFWRVGEESHIVDVTGGGNAFVGGLLAGLLLTRDLRAACIYGTTAASFAIEGRGIPRLSTEGGHELWNGVDVWERLKEMVRRTELLEQSSS
ncbi:hypothetical protein CcaverHIS641_0304800 [Cutaneotrichosporon cavernicola]|nr:hypothetical protein CcaverHIS641_0304800 [Cutaneotrichosporon cavernicola]